MFYYDAHCHIMPVRQMIKASQSGVAYFICNATAPDNWDDVYALAKQVEGVYPCVGIHPWFIDELRADWQIKMRLMLEKDANMMIGEIGLDGSRSNLTNQAIIFSKCLKLARHYNRPVHIHGYKAWQNIADILAYYPDITCLFHRFSGSEALVRKLMKVSNAYFSVMTAKPIPFIPPERILVETDSPDGLHKPSNVIELIERLHLNKDKLADNFCRFIGDRTPTCGLSPKAYIQSILPEQ